MWPASPDQGPWGQATLRTRKTSSERLAFKALICPFDLPALVGTSILSLEFTSLDDISCEPLLTLKSSWFNSPLQPIPGRSLRHLLWFPSHY